MRGMMVSFGNASGPLSDINVPQMLQPKGLFFVRPSMQQYLSTKEELDQERIGLERALVRITELEKQLDILESELSKKN